MRARAATRPDLEQLPPQVAAYIESVETRLERLRKDAARLAIQLRQEELKVEAYQRALDAADLPLPFTPETSVYERHCPHCRLTFDRRGFATHEQACARSHGVPPVTT